MEPPTWECHLPATVLGPVQNKSTGTPSALPKAPCPPNPDAWGARAHFPPSPSSTSIRYFGTGGHSLACSSTGLYGPSPAGHPHLCSKATPFSGASGFAPRPPWLYWPDAPGKGLTP